MTLESIESRYKEIVLTLAHNPSFKDLDVLGRAYRPLSTKGDDNGGIFYGYEKGKYFEAATERGQETYRKETENPNEFLSKLVKRMASGIALEWELKNRVQHQDSRSLLFKKHIEILQSIDKEWAEEQENHYKQILIRHPLDDSKIDRIDYSADLQRQGVAKQEAWRLAVEKYPEPGGT